MDEAECEHDHEEGQGVEHAAQVRPEELADGEIAQQTEMLVGPYELHDFFLYHVVRNGFRPAKVLWLAEHAFAGKYDQAEIRHWLRQFLTRFFAQQYKRSAMPDGPKVGSVALSPRGDWRHASRGRAAGPGRTGRRRRTTACRWRPGS